MKYWTLFEVPPPLDLRSAPYARPKLAEREVSNAFMCKWLKRISDQELREFRLRISKPVRV